MYNAIYLGGIGMNVAQAPPSGLRIELVLRDARTGEQVLDWKGLWRSIGEAAPEINWLSATIFTRLGVETDVVGGSLSRHGADWSSDDDRMLRVLVSEGFSDGVIASKTGRTQAAVTRRRNRLGIGKRR
jgi:hypothetical protein